MKYYELIIVWATGEKETAQYKTYERADNARDGLKMAFGEQIAFMCINEKFNAGNNVVNIIV